MNNNMPDLTGITIGDNGELLSLDNEQRTLIERLSAVDGVRVNGATYTKITCKGEIEYCADSKTVWFTSDTFIGDAHSPTEPLGDDTVVELFSKW